MTTLELLESIRESEIKTNAIIDHIERLHRIAKCAHKSKKYAESIVEKLGKLETELNEHIDRSYDLKLRGYVLLEKLDGYERAIMERYYFLGESWETVAINTHWSERQVFLLRKKALKHLEERKGNNGQNDTDN